MCGCKVCARGHPWSDGGGNGHCVWCVVGERAAVWNRGMAEDGSQFAKTSKLDRIEAWERRWRDWFEEGFGEIGGGCKDGIGGGGFGHGRMRWEPLQSVGVAFGASLGDVGPVAAIVMRSRAKVPARGAVAGAGFADRGLTVHNDFDAEGTEWRAVKFEGAMELGVGGQAWVDARGADHIES